MGELDGMARWSDSQKNKYGRTRRIDGVSDLPSRRGGKKG